MDQLLKVGDVKVLQHPLIKIRQHNRQATKINKKSGLAIDEHLRFFAELLTEADSAVTRKEKHILLYKLRKTEKLSGYVISNKTKQELMRLRKNTSKSVYLLDLFLYRIQKLIGLGRRRLNS